MPKPNEPLRDFLNELRAQLRKQSVSQKEVAKWLGIGQSQVSRILSGRQSLTIQYLEVILRRANIVNGKKLYSRLRKVMEE